MEDICLSVDGRKQIDELVEIAVKSGGVAPRPPQEHGFMYEHRFEDIDGHTWELIYMENSK